MSNSANITADALALQERDEFRNAGWVKAISPAKVNLYLGIGVKRPDGYHDALSIMHAINLHDVVYVRWRTPEADNVVSTPLTRMVANCDVAVSNVASEDNLASKAVLALAEAFDRPASDTALEIRIEKDIPSEAGLGGGSSNAAAALLAAAHLWQLDMDDAKTASTVESVARNLGADVAFFLRGGCAIYDGVGDSFARSLEPSKQSIALVKPASGVSTPAAYKALDDTRKDQGNDAANTAVVSADVFREARAAQDIQLFNSLTQAAESLAPELAEVRAWTKAQPGVLGALLCGSGATTFAICDNFDSAYRVAANARKNGWWARTSSLGSLRAMLLDAPMKETR